MLRASADEVQAKDLIIWSNFQHIASIDVGLYDKFIVCQSTAGGPQSSRGNSFVYDPGQKLFSIEPSPVNFAGKVHKSQPNFDAIFDSDMRKLLAILGLLFSSIATHAADLPVIKDSEAIQYVGKNVEVRGFVVSVTISPLGTAFINFGRDYPNQTFAGFIAAGSKIATDKRIATLQGKLVSITGKIELYQGKPEIKVMSKDQINVLVPSSAR